MLYTVFFQSIRKKKGNCLNLFWFVVVPLVANFELAIDTDVRSHTNEALSLTDLVLTRVLCK